MPRFPDEFIPGLEKLPYQFLQVGEGMDLKQALGQFAILPQLTRYSRPVCSLKQLEKNRRNSLMVGFGESDNILFLLFSFVSIPIDDSFVILGDDSFPCVILGMTDSIFHNSFEIHNLKVFCHLRG